MIIKGSHASSACRRSHPPRWSAISLFSSRQLTAVISLQAYYYDEKALLSNEEFDNLKEDLIWAGSKVAVLRYAPSPFTQVCFTLPNFAKSTINAFLSAERTAVQSCVSSARHKVLWSQSPRKQGMADSTFSYACSTTEQRFLEASMAYQAGKPIVSDEEFDQLKRELRMKNSMVIQQVHIHPTLVDLSQ